MLKITGPKVELIIQKDRGNYQGLKFTDQVVKLLEQALDSAISIPGAEWMSRRILANFPVVYAARALGPTCSAVTTGSTRDAVAERAP